MAFPNRTTYVQAFWISLLSVTALSLCSASVSAGQAEDLAAKEDAAKGTGLDPTEVVGRIEFNYNYTERENKTERHSGVLVLEKDVNATSVFAVDVPLVAAKLPIGDEQYGIGDVRFRFRKLAYKSGKFATAFGTGLELDTASDDQLGDGNASLRVSMFNSYKHGEWIFAAFNSVSYSEDENYNQVTVAPMVAYQPMGTYLSYVRLFLPVGYLTEREESVTNVFLNLGKVMPNKDIYAIGTKQNLSGPDDDQFVFLLSYRRLF